MGNIGSKLNEENNEVDYRSYFVDHGMLLVLHYSQKDGFREQEMKVEGPQDGEHNGVPYVDVCSWLKHLGFDPHSTTHEDDTLLLSKVGGSEWAVVVDMTCTFEHIVFVDNMGDLAALLVQLAPVFSANKAAST